MSDRTFYTYAYLREDGTPYYIGKGCGRRAFKGHHNVPVPPKERVLFLKKHLTEEESLRHEVYMIFVFGRKNIGTGILWNFTDGGEGTSGRVWTDEQRKQISESLLGHPVSDATRELQSKNNWLRNNEIPQSYRDKQREISLANGNTPPVKTGTSWWTNGEETRMQEDCPGEGWVKGRGEIHTPGFRERVRQRCLTEGLPTSFDKTGTKWWTNGSKTIMSKECPGEGWREGRK
jgi:hypothetical protein